MHPPASVTVDVERPRWLAVWMLAGWSAGILLGALWCLADAEKAAGWRVVLLGLAVVAAGGLLKWQWHRLLPGRLQWDGEDWIWRPFVGNGCAESRGVATVYLDLQQVMLLRFVPVQGMSEWLWVESSMCAQHWAALRRAALGYAGRSAAPGEQNGPLPP